MCKKKIETAADIDGVKNAHWNKKTKILILEYDTIKTSIEKIQIRIAATGYDTPLYRANDEKYKALHHCCQYPRKL